MSDPTPAERAARAIPCDFPMGHEHCEEMRESCAALYRPAVEREIKESERRALWGMAETLWKFTRSQCMYCCTDEIAWRDGRIEHSYRAAEHLAHAEVNGCQAQRLVMEMIARTFPTVECGCAYGEDCGGACNGTALLAKRGVWPVLIGGGR